MQFSNVPECPNTKYELPPEYRPKMKGYLDNMKVEKNKAKENLSTG
jgi:hypothetical protein